jgi:hypothetical protein
MVETKAQAKYNNNKKPTFYSVSCKALCLQINERINKRIQAISQLILKNALSTARRTQSTSSA